MGNNISKKKFSGLEKPNFWMIAPTFVFLFATTTLLMAIILLLSFKNVNLSMPYLPQKYIGFDNFVNALTTADYWKSIQRTGLYLTAILIELAIGSLIATIFFLLKDSMFTKILRSLMLVSLFVPPVVSGIIWRNMMLPGVGVLPYIFGDINWLGSPKLIMVTVIMIDVWQWMPFVMLLIYSYMQSINPSVLEAANIDGANTWLTVRKIILPISLSGILVAAVIRLIFAFRSFDNVWSVAQGGPASASETLPIYLYKQSFQIFKSSYGAAVAILLLIALVIIAKQFFNYIERMREVELD